MFLGRFAYALPVLALAGSFAGKRRRRPPPHLPDAWAAVHRPLLGVIVILYLLQYSRRCARPIVEHFLMLAGKTF